MVSRWVVTLVMLAMARVSLAHVAFWANGMFGLNAPKKITDTPNYNNNAPVAPLRQFERLKTAEWFAHGYQDLPPAEGDFMELEAGGVFTGELGCNRAFTSFRDPRIADKELSEYACPAVGPMHTANKIGQAPDNSLLGGTSLAIAYTSDVATLKPTDMTVISVNYTSVWYRLVDYPIPAGLPNCPGGGCLCTWNWIHGAQHGEGYGNEIYNLLYRCKVTGQTDDSHTVSLGAGTVPKRCDEDPGDCITGPKQPMYMYQADGNNMNQSTWPPTYNERYGFKDGAQMDLFDGPNSSPPTTSSQSAATFADTTSSSSASSTARIPFTAPSAGSDSGQRTMGHCKRHKRQKRHKRLAERKVGPPRVLLFSE